MKPVRAIRRELGSYASLRKTPYGMAPVLLIGFIGFFQAFDTAAFGLAGPEIVKDLGIDVNRIVGLASVVGFFGIFAAIGLAWYADRARRLPLLGLGTILSGVAGALSSRGSSFVTIGSTRVIDDVSAKGADLPSFSLLADYYPPDVRGRVFALLGMLGRFASLVSPVVAGIAISVYGWRPVLLAVAVPLIVLGIAVIFVLKEPVRGYMERAHLGVDEARAATPVEPPSFAEGWRTVWAVRTLRRFFIANVFSDAGALAFSLYLPFFYTERYGLNALERGLVSLPSAIAVLVGGVMGGGLIDRLTARDPGRVLTVFGLFAVIAAVGQAGIAFAPPLAFIVVLNCVLGFGLALVGPAGTLVYAQVVPPSARTLGVQFGGLAALPGIVIALPIFQTIYGTYGYRLTFLAAVPMLVVGGAISATAGSFFELDRRAAFAAALADEAYRQARLSGDDALLICRQVDVDHSGVQVLFGVDLDVRQGEIVALLGTNGAGKSTILRAISGSHEASGGAILFDGRDITHMPPHEIARRGVAHMPGGRGVFPGLTVRDNLLVGAGVEADLPEVFEIFPVLADRQAEVAGSLSGGEQQMLSLAQAFLERPKLLMIDELSLGLAPGVVGQLLDVVRAIAAQGVTIIVVEQSVNVALTIAERAVFLEKGEVRFVGPTAELLARPDILRAVYVKGAGALGGSSAGGATRTKAAGDRVALELEGITKRYGGVLAVDHVDLRLHEGEVLGIIGPNGSGKTTLFDCISGFTPTDGGTVHLDGVDISRLGPAERAGKGLVRRFQDARLFPSLTVEDVLLLALDADLEVRGIAQHLVAAPRARRSERRARQQVERLLELVDLGDQRNRACRELSTGQRRIVDLACVVAAQPKVLLLDEPSSGIAQAETEALGPLIRRITDETGCSTLIIEHDMPLIRAVADELVALERGAVLLQGPAAVVLDDERVVRSYLGTDDAAVARSGNR